MRSRRSLAEVRDEISKARASAEAASEELASLRKEAGGTGPMSEKEEEDGHIKVVLHVLDCFTTI